VDARRPAPGAGASPRDVPGPRRRFNPGTTRAAEVIGKEICRTTSSDFRHRVLKLYGTPYADNRVDANTEYLENVCGAEVVVVAAERAYFREDLAEELTFATLVKDSTVTTILAANDRMIKGALKAVDRALSQADADRLIIAGFDWTEDYLLTEGLQVASGDQYMSTPFMGVWKTVVNVIETVQSFRLNTTADLQRFFLTEGSTQFETASSCQFSAAEGYILDEVLVAYEPGVRAKPKGDENAPVVVGVGLHDVAVEQIDTAGGAFTATSWVTLEWVDPRLEFDTHIYAGTLRVDAARIWTPDVYIANIVTSSMSQTIKTLPATIGPDGTVRVVFQAVGDFTCGMNIRPYPRGAASDALFARGATGPAGTTRTTAPSTSPSPTP